jgi:hypothetical protein
MMMRMKMSELVRRFDVIDQKLDRILENLDETTEVILDSKTAKDRARPALQRKVKEKRASDAQGEGN